jgi:type VI secretion system secreted protein VgrG
MPIKQDSRWLALKTKSSLGPDDLGLRSFSVHERLSRLFQIEAELSSEKGAVNLDDVVGHEATIRLDTAQGHRYFHGFVSRMVQVASEGEYAHYRAVIVPWLWLLTRTSDCRIWVAKDDPASGQTVPQIIEAVFKLHGFSDYKLSLNGTYAKREFCVQYRETDFNFVSRLMEQEGIYYYFEHQDGKHTLVLADSISSHKPFPDYADVTFHEAKQGAAVREVMTDWTMEKEVQPVASALQDFDFKKPKTSLVVSTNTSRKYGEAKYEIYDYPGEYIDHGDGQRVADVRLAEFQTQYETLYGQASVRGLSSGCTFKLKNHPRADQNREYLITGVSLHADAGEFATNDQRGSDFFSCNVTCIDKTQQFRPARLTPKPIVQGPQTAIVAGTAGEEIYTDQYARVKVHFHWDRHDKSNQDSSCWVRVTQYWAGKSWGSIHIPRIGQEVVVEFLEGDPDRPIITGRVYNADQTAPYGLPANKTQSGIKSRSSSGGSSSNFNEIRFEDKMGSEEVYIHAEKDQNNVVEHDETTKVGHDRTENVGNNENITVVKDRTENVGNNETITIAKDRTESVGNNETITIAQNRTEQVGANESITVAKSRTRNVGQNETVTVALMRAHNVGVNEAITVGAAQAITVGADQATTVGGAQQNTVGKDRASTIGANDSLSVTKKLTIDAGEEITITTGSASISMKKDGTIQISGKDITIEGSGAINATASKNLTMKGQKILQN